MLEIQATLAALRNDQRRAALLIEEAKLVMSANGIVNTDTHVTLLSTEIAIHLQNGDIEAAHFVSRKLREVLARKPYVDSELWTSRRLLSKYQDASIALAGGDLGEAIDRLLVLLEEAEDTNESVVRGLCHSSMARIQKQFDLLSGALVHATLAEQAWFSIQRPERALGDRLLRAQMLADLGNLSPAIDLLEGIEAQFKADSRSQYLRAESLSVRAGIASALGQPDRALSLMIESAEATPPIVLGEPFARSIAWITTYLLAQTTGDSDAMARAATELEALEESEHIGSVQSDVLALFHKVATSSRAEALAEIDAFKERWPDFARTMTASAAEDLLEGFWFAHYEPSMQKDVLEYWDHIRHLMGEDDEVIRGQVRRANCLPVLNRILSRWCDEIDPLLQFELVEMSRAGALSPSRGLGVATSGVATPLRKDRLALRQASRRHLEEYASSGRAGPTSGGLDRR